MMTARSRSCNAPVTISDADAELPLMSTASGKSGSIGSDSVRYTRRESSVRPFGAYHFGAFRDDIPSIFTASCMMPPPLLR